jgi:threonine synthase
MKLYSTNNHNLSVDFATAVFNSMPLDKGLYMPSYIPQLDQEFINQIDKFSL